MNTAARLLRAALAFIGVLATTGCPTSSEVALDLLDVEVPAAYYGNPTSGEIPARSWVEDFQDDQLAAIVTEALANNRDLRAASARMDAAEARVQVANSGRLPNIGGRFDANRTQRVITSGSRLVGSSPGAISTSITNNFNLGLNLAWEIDLWGQIRNRVRAAREDYAASLGDYYAAELSLAAGTARSWFNAITSEAQLRLARDTLDSFQSSLQVVEGSFQKGVVTALDLRLARANLAGARAALSGRERERDTARKALETLLGRYPSGQFTSPQSLPGLPTPRPPGLPSGLIGRRPDIVASQARLAASLERVKAARKEYLPSVRITSGAGLVSEELYEILDLQLLAWNIASGITQPIFEGGRIRAEVAIAEAQKNEALNLYAQQVLDAFFEVERALVAEGFLRDQVAALQDTARESIAAEELALSEYNRGLVDIITVLESQRRSFQSQRDLIDVKNLLLQNRIDLYLALGGDFAEPPILEDL